MALAAAMPAHAIYKWVDKKVCLDDKDRPAHIAELKRAVGEFCD
ncbi:MAG: hypothetical protein ABIR98_01885 [Usitatibacter sp.]